MKRTLLIALLVLAPLRAEWTDLKTGLDAREAATCVGAPLFCTKAKSGVFETWTYDDGAYISFVNGRVAYWQPPKAERTMGLSR